MRIALAARTAVQLEAVRREIEADGGRAIAVPTDMADEAQIKALVAATLERFGRLDAVINNAGIGAFGPLEKTTTADWDRILAVNARGPFILCRQAIPHLRAGGGGHVINIASVVAVKGYENQSAYAASKHALLGMTKSLAKEVQPDHIRVHAICPGGVDTDLAAAARPDLDRAILIGPDEIADVVVFLLTHRGNAVIDQIDLRRASDTAWA